MADNFAFDFNGDFIELQPVGLVEYVEKAERELQNLHQTGGKLL